MAIQVDPDDQFHVVRDGTVMTVSLEELDAAYQRDSITDETLIWQEGLVEWMRLDTLLHTLEQQDGPLPERAPSLPDTYYVMVAPDEVKQMSLDLLDDAYRLDVIDDQTLIWQPGYTEWIPLAALIGPVDAHQSIAPQIPNTAIVHPAGIAPSSDLDGSLAPSALWTPPESPRASPWYGRTLIFFAVLGATVVSYRTGFVESTAHELNREAWTKQVESKLGAPGVDTPHGMDRFLLELKEEHGLAELSETDPVPTAPSDEEKKAGEGKGASEKVGADAAKKTDAATQKEPNQTTPNASAAAFSNTLQGKPKQAPAKKVRGKRRRSGSPTQFRGGDPNDPMNGSL